jgi:exopolysaccharide transport family protein
LSGVKITGNRNFNFAVHFPQPYNDGAGILMDSGPLVQVNAQAMPEQKTALQLDFGKYPGYPVYPPSQESDSPLREYLRILIKRRWVILSTVTLIVGSVAIASLRSTKIYEAVGSIAINKPDPMQFAFHDSAGSGEDYYDPSDLDTEVRILRSDLLALQVIKQLNLDHQSAFGGTPDSPLPLTTDDISNDSPQSSAVLASFKGNLRVSLVPNTRVIEIAYRSPDKTLAARIVNTLANTYVEQNFKTRFESTMQASDWLSKQLVDLQMKVESSEEKLVKYQKDHEIVGVDEKQNTTTAKLDELNRELTAAEGERMEKESMYRMVQAGNPDAVAAATMGTGSSASPGGSNLLEKLREQQADLKIQIANLSTQFGPSYPKVAQLDNQVKEVNAQIDIETAKAVNRLRSEFLAAQQHENLLHAALEAQKQEANKLNESAIEYSLLKRDVDSNRSLYDGLLQKLKEAGVTAGLKSNNFRIVDVARVPTYPSEPNIPRNLAMALALGLSTGIGLAFLMDSLDNTIRTPEQAQAISGLPSLGMIPMGSRLNDGTSNRQKLAAGSSKFGSSKEAVELITQARPQSQMAESYRAVRTSILLTSAGTPPKIVLITSALPQEGKTTTSINCAVVLAQKGSRVLLVDCDLRRPSIHKTLGMGPRAGLSNVLTGNATLQQATVRSTILPNLFILPAGTPPPNPAELLASAGMKHILTQMREQYDHIVIDTPPTLSVTDAVVLSTAADSVVLVIRSGQTTKQALRRARELLSQVNARVSGILLNAVDLNSADYHYYEYQGKYGNRYYQDEGTAEPAPDAENASKAASSGL